MFNHCIDCVGATNCFAEECEFYPPGQGPCPGFEYDDSMDDPYTYYGSEAYTDRQVEETYEFIDWMEMAGYNDPPTHGEMVQEHFDRWHGRRQEKHK